MPYYIGEMVDGKVLDRRTTRQPVGIEMPAARNWTFFEDERPVLWTSDEVNDPRLIKIADDGKEKLSQTARQVLGDIANDGRPINASMNFDETIANLLMVPVNGRWQPLRPSKSRARFEVKLGPDKLLWTEPRAPGRNTKTYTDSFDRANSTTLGTFSGGTVTWIEATGTVLAITSNQLTATNIPDGTDCSCFGDTDVDTDDNYAQVALTTLTRNSGDIGVFLYTGCNDDGSSGYLFNIFNDGSGARELYRASTFGLLDSDATATTSGTLRIERDGSSILAYVGGVEILSATNSAESTGAGFRRAGLLAFADSTSTNDAAWNDFVYGDLDAGGGVANRRRRFLMAA